MALDFVFLSCSVSLCAELCYVTFGVLLMGTNLRGKGGKIREKKAVFEGYLRKCFGANFAEK